MGFGHLCVFDLKKNTLKALSDPLDADFTDVVTSKVNPKPQTLNPKP